MSEHVDVAVRHDHGEGEDDRTVGRARRCKS
jgi:hypothetical protein